MSGLREPLQLFEHDHEPEMQVRARGVDPELHVERTPQRQARAQVFARFDVVEPVEQVLDVGEVGESGHVVLPTIAFRARSLRPNDRRRPFRCSGSPCAR